jgi:hypothetical protein
MARIRTIKPEFWQNEQIAGLREHARLLAIALLNHADDAGCFLASHQLVRAACFPFEEDSKNVLGSIQELSSIGYIEVRNCDGKQIGRICKFLDHQRIDKPQKSKLFEVFTANCKGNDCSKNVLGTVLEDSKNVPRLERKGKEGEQGMEQGGEGEREPLSPPAIKKDSVSIPEEIADHWERWCNFRLSIDGREVNSIQAETILMDLGRRGWEKAAKDIDFSIRKSAKSILDSDNDFDSRRLAHQTSARGFTT